MNCTNTLKARTGQHRLVSGGRPLRWKQPSRQRLRCQAFLGAATSLPTAASGWLIAGTVLAAVRLGRKQAEDERMAQLQARPSSQQE